MRRFSTIAALTLTILLSPAGWLGAGTAFAHNTLIGSEPAGGAQLTTGPEQVRLTFNQPVRTGAGYNAVNVIGPGGTSWTGGPVRVEGNMVSVPVRELGPAGGYTIGYRVLSHDGHSITGKVTFTVTSPRQGPPPAAAPPEKAGQHQGTSGTMPVWPWVAGAAALVALGVLLALRLANSRR